MSADDGLSLDAAELSVEVAHALADRQTLVTGVVGQDAYLGAGATAAIQPSSDALQTAIARIAASGSTASHIRLRPGLAVRVDVPGVRRSSSAQRLDARTAELRRIASTIRDDRAGIARLRSSLQKTVAGVDAELVDLANRLPGLEQGVLAANPLAGDAEKGALAQALTVARSTSTTPAQLAGYVTAAKNVESSQADAATKAAAAAAAAKAAAAQPAGPADPHCAAPVTGVKHIYVSIAQQHLWACTGPVLVLESAVTTGASALTNVHDATPTGTFRIDGKARNVHLVGHDANGSWDDAVAYWIPYIGSTYGFHDASWQTFPFGSPLYTTQGSHGCVHLPTDTIAQIYAWAPVGTQVTIG